MKKFFSKFFEALSIVFVASFLILASPYILTGLIIFTIVNYLKYKRTKYYIDTKDKYSWLCTTSAYINFYNDIKKANLPIEYYRDKKVKTTGYGYFIYKDVLILCDYALNMVYFDYGQDEWYIYEEHGDIQLKDMVEEEIKKANEFFGENRCNKAIVFVNDETLDEAPEKYYKNVELLRVTDTDEISALNEFIQK